MKPQPTKHAGKAAKPETAHYAFLEGEEMFYRAKPYKGAKGTHHIILDFPNVSSANRRLRWEKLSEEQKVEAIAKAQFESEGLRCFPVMRWNRAQHRVKEIYRKDARSILNLISP